MSTFTSELQFLTDGGELGALMRSHDWSSSPLGPPDEWPQSLRAIVGLLLHSKFPMFVAWGSELGFLYNDAYAEILGNKHPAALGCRFDEIWSEIWADIKPLVDAAMAGEGTYREDLALVMNRKGFDEQTWFTFSYSPVRDESGGVAGMFCVCTETTAQVLSEQRQAFRIGLEQALSGIGAPREVMAAAVEALGRHLGANRVGYSEIQSDGDTIVCDACFADGVEPLIGIMSLTDFGRDSVDRQRRGETEVCSDIRADPAQAQATWAAIDTRSYMSVPLIRDGRLSASLYVNFRNVHRWTPEEIALVEDVAGRTWAAVEQAKAETALSESEARYRALFDSLDTGFCVIELKFGADDHPLDYRFVEVNGAFAAQTGLEDAAGKWMRDLAPNHEQHWFDLYGGVALTRQPVRFENPAVVLGDRWYDVHAFPFGEPEARRVAILFNDISDRRRAERSLQELNADLEARVEERTAELVKAQEALAQSQKMDAVGQLTGGIAHDFNNLLQGVAGSLDLIRRKPDDVDRVRRWAEAGLQSAERGAKLTGQLLAFSRAQKIDLAPLLVSSLVAGMNELLVRTLGPTVHLVMDLAADPFPVCSDATQLEMAVLNLAINARDAMPGGGDLSISTRAVRIEDDPELERDDYIELTVRDTGTGMPPEVMARALDPFFTTKGVGKGTGLGLSQVYGIARQAGGTARIESTPGLGTSVRLYLRRTDAHVSSGVEPDRSETETGTRAATILVVDDDSDVRRFLIDSLDGLGYRCIEAEDGPGALARLDERAPDAMLVDFAMPGMNGAEVARAAWKQRPGLPVIFASGYAETAAIEDVAGAEALVLRKPFRVDQLQSILNEALSGRS